MKFAFRGLIVLGLASFLPGCGGSAAQGPTEETQSKVQDASRDIAKKFAESSKQASKRPAHVFRPQ